MSFNEISARLSISPFFLSSFPGSEEEARKERGEMGTDREDIGRPSTAIEKETRERRGKDIQLKCPRSG